MDRLETLITGCGTLSHAIARLTKCRIFCNDEMQLLEMSREMPEHDYIQGDIRDRDAVRHATMGIGRLFHCAAMKGVPSCEESPVEAVKTNILGSINICEFAPKKTIAVSTDKAVHPINTYGATKMIMERIFLHYGFSCARFGNFVGSRGSVIPLWEKQDVLTVTDERMRRYWVSPYRAAQWLLIWSEKMKGGEIFIPKMCESGIMELIKDKPYKIIGIRKGEKLEEELGLNLQDMGDYWLDNC